MVDNELEYICVNHNQSKLSNNWPRKKLYWNCNDILFEIKIQ